MNFITSHGIKVSYSPLTNDKEFNLGFAIFYLSNLNLAQGEVELVSVHTPNQERFHMKGGW